MSRFMLRKLENKKNNNRKHIIVNCDYMKGKMYQLNLPSLHNRTHSKVMRHGSVGKPGPRYVLIHPIRLRHSV